MSSSDDGLNDILLEAVLRQKTRLVRFYVGWNNDPSYRVQGLALVHIAVLEEDAELLAGALAHGMSPDAFTDLGDTPLHILARKKKASFAVVEQLFQMLRRGGANMYARNAKGSTPLDTAHEYGNSALTSLMSDTRPTYMLKRDWSVFEQWHPTLPTPAVIKDM
jgi:ankyrin repeat protein